jgi:hypothetical protein
MGLMPDASRPVGDLTDDQIRKRLRVPVQEAAHLLGISPEAVRSRLYRGTLDKETGTDGTVYVRLHADQVRPNDEQTVDRSQPNTEFVGELRARVEDLREQLAEEREARRRADTIIAQLARTTEEQARTIRELEAPQEVPEDAETVEREPEGAEPRPDAPGPQEGAQRRPWWRRWFGGSTRT